MRSAAPEEPRAAVPLGGDLFRFLMGDGSTLDLDLEPLRHLPELAVAASDPDLLDGLTVTDGRVALPAAPPLSWDQVRRLAGLPPPRGFSVDTHLFRELGELLVGRDSTAVLELIKNAYDADATTVIVDGQGLRTPEAVLRVVDDGSGMTRERFESAFLRVASRSKEGQGRRSARFGRRYTGEKGIGRLAAHKLARRLSVVSIPLHGDLGTAPAGAGVSAVLDWDAIEAQDSLEDLDRGLSVSSVPHQPGQVPGSAFELGHLRSVWAAADLTRFVREMREARPPVVLTDPTTGPRLSDDPLVARPAINDTSSDDPGFEVSLTGDLDVGDDLFIQASADFRWLLEIDATTEIVRYQVTPVAAYARGEPLARAYRFQRTVPLQGRPGFVARIFTYPGASTRRGPLTSFVRSSTGVRVYLEGFRVLPYGDPGDDWLGIDRDYRTGPRYYTLDVDADTSDAVEVDRREALAATGNTGYVGGVFLTDAAAGGLRSLVNREGFVPDDTFERLTDLVSTGVKLSVRVRRAVGNAVKERETAEDLARALRRAPDVAAMGPHPTEGPPGLEFQDATADDVGEAEAPVPRRPPEFDSGSTAEVLQPPVLPQLATRVLDEAGAAVSALRASPMGVSDPGRVAAVLTGFDVAAAELSRLRGQQPDLRVLASVGLQLGAFIHDINGLLGQTRTVRELLAPLVGDASLTRPQAVRVRRVGAALDDLAQALDRQASYLTDVVSTDSRRRRRRVLVGERLEVSRRLLADRLARLGVQLTDALPEGLRTPPMFPAEVTVLLNNLLTNAVKNAGSPGRVVVSGALLGRQGATLLIANTGAAVALDDAERWFLPFETTTTDVDEVLGQGLGLGLPITRALVDDYRGDVRFVEPPPGYATAVRVDLPDPQELR